jgi:hypothetical protein
MRTSIALLFKRSRKNLLSTALSIGVSLSFCLGLGFSTNVSARCESDPWRGRDKSVSDRWANLIFDRKFEALDDELEDRLIRYRAGESTDLNLWIDVTRVVDRGSRVQPLLAEWFNTRTKSKFAPIFLGMFHRNEGFLKRGNKYSDQTSPEQFAAMEAEFIKSYAFYRMGMVRDPNIGLIYAGMISLASAGFRPTAEQPARRHTVQFNTLSTSSTAGLVPQEPLEWLDLGLQKDAASMALRDTASAAFNPKWGGSFELLDELKNKPENAALKEADRQFIEYRILMEKAGFERGISKKHRNAISYAVSAHQVCSSKEALWLASESGYDLEDWKIVKSLMNTYLEIDSSSIRAYSKRGYASENLGEMADAVADYMISIKLGDAWAMNRIGWFYETNRYLPKDLVKARALYEQAAAKGNPTAKAALAKMLAIN